MTHKTITVQTIVNAPIEKVWECWNNPTHIMLWCHAADDWEVPYAENDLHVGKSFKTTMASKDKVHSFDVIGVYSDIKEHALIEYDMSDERHVKVEFIPVEEGIKVIETFDMEQQNSQEMQRAGWQAILDNFKKYTESN